MFCTFYMSHWQKMSNNSEKVFFHLLCIPWQRYMVIYSIDFHFIISNVCVFWFVSKLTRRVPLVEQERLTIPEHLSSLPVFSGVRVTRSSVLCVCFVDRCLSFCTFFWPLCCLFFFYLRILFTPLVSSISSWICRFFIHTGIWIVCSNADHTHKSNLNI